MRSRTNQIIIRLSDEELAGLAENAAEYVAIGRELAAQGLLAEGAAPNASC